MFGFSGFSLIKIHLNDLTMLTGEAAFEISLFNSRTTASGAVLVNLASMCFRHRQIKASATLVTQYLNHMWTSPASNANILFSYILPLPPGNVFK